MMEQKIESLKRALKESKYTVALCGSGILEEEGYMMLKKPERAYDIETRYGVSPEYIFSDGYYSTRPDKFFEFYRNEVLLDIEPGDSPRKLAELERAGMLDCIVTSNIYNLSGRAGCRNVVNLHGNIYDNKCPHCGRSYSVDYIKNTVKVPRCESCGSVIRPMVSLFGDMLDGQLIARTATELEKADVLLILGTTLDSEVFHNYVKYFDGSRLIVVHKEPHLKDRYADLVICDDPKNVLNAL
ncbi:MAG: Sir2 family NAD-dependent protein deacetylase [Bariatricus sp.]|nr:Sir2 family NAD-dependent protein deacetylase [Bariatricus sp.]